MVSGRSFFSSTDPLPHGAALPVFDFWKTESVYLVWRQGYEHLVTHHESFLFGYHTEASNLGCEEQLPEVNLGSESVTLFKYHCCDSFLGLSGTLSQFEEVRDQMEPKGLL